MGKQTIRFFDPVEETLEKLYKNNLLKKPSELPLDIRRVFFLMPNGDFLSMNENHDATIERYTTKREYTPNGDVKPMEHFQHTSFFTELNVIHVNYSPKENNRLDLVFLSSPTPAQLRTIYRTYKDVPDLWITYDVVDLNKPFSVSGEGYRDMITDLREKNYLPKERDSGK